MLVVLLLFLGEGKGERIKRSKRVCSWESDSPQSSEVGGWGRVGLWELQAGSGVSEKREPLNWLTWCVCHRAKWGPEKGICLIYRKRSPTFCIPAFQTWDFHQTQLLSSINHHSHTMLLLSSFYRCGMWSPGWLSNIPKVTQLASDRATIPTRVRWVGGTVKVQISIK